MSVVTISEEVVKTESSIIYLYIVNFIYKGVNAISMQCCQGHNLLGKCEADTLIAPVELGVELPHEQVAQEDHRWVLGSAGEPTNARENLLPCDDIRGIYLL